MHAQCGAGLHAIIFIETAIFIESKATGFEKTLTRPLTNLMKTFAKL